MLKERGGGSVVDPNSEYKLAVDGRDVKFSLINAEMYVVIYSQIYSQMS